MKRNNKKKSFTDVILQNIEYGLSTKKSEKRKEERIRQLYYFGISRKRLCLYRTRLPRLRHGTLRVDLKGYQVPFIEL